MAEIASAPPLRDQIAHDARPLRRREIVRAVIQREQHEQRDDGMLVEQHRHEHNREPQRCLDAAANEHDALTPGIAAEPGGEELRQRAEQRRQSREQRNLRRGGAQEQRECGEVGFPAAGLDRERHAVADRMAQRPVDHRVLRESVRRHGLQRDVGRPQQALGPRFDGALAAGERQRLTRHRGRLLVVAGREVQLAELDPKHGIVRIDAQGALEQGGRLAVVARVALGPALLQQSLARAGRIAARARPRIAGGRLARLPCVGGGSDNVAQPAARTPIKVTVAQRAEESGAIVRSRSIVRVEPSHHFAPTPRVSLQPKARGWRSRAGTGTATAPAQRAAVGAPVK